MRVLEFTEQEEKYVCQYVSAGPEIVQIERVGSGRLAVATHIEGMTPIPYKEIYNKEVQIRIDVPPGMTVTITSDVEVTECKALSAIIPQPVPFSCSDEAICYDSEENPLFVNL